MQYLGKHKLNKATDFSQIQPLFICLGFPKCATTWIHRQLEIHPEVGCTSTKEVTYWTKNYAEGEDWYLSHFPVDLQHKIYAEVTPHYMSSISLSRIAKDLSGQDLKFMVCLRDPCQRSYSHYHDVLRAGRTSGDFRKALNDIPELLNQSLYGKRIEEFLQFFPRASLHVGFYEDIASSPEAFMRDVYQFIGVDQDFVSSNASAVVNPGRRATKFEVWLKRTEMWVKSAGLKREHLVKLGLWDKIDAFYRKLANKRPLPKINDQELAHIRTLIHDDLELLKDLGVDWGDRWSSCPEHLKHF